MTTTKQDIESALIAFSNAGFNAAFPEVPIVWGNAPFNYAAPPDVYCTAMVSLDHTEGLAINSQYDRHYGNIHFCIITKTGLGSGVANSCADWLYKLYKHASIAGIEVRDAKMDGEGPSRGTWEVNVTVPFVTSPL